MIIRLGIIGTGRIAKRMVVDAKMVEGVQTACVYNPNGLSAEQFSQSEGVGKAFSDFSQFLKNVDAVYIASPHETHYAYAKQAIRARKHVLCEKPMCLSVVQVKELYELSRMNNVVLQEAIKTAFFPGFHKMLECAKSGAVGEIVDVEACFTKIEPENGRELSDVKYGGSVTELGSYVLLPIVKLLGSEHKNVSYLSVSNDKGIDTYSKIIINYKGRMALGKVGLATKSEGNLVVAGTRGFIHCPAPWWLTKHIEIKDMNGQTVETYEYDFEGSGLQHELENFVGRIRGSADSLISEEESIWIISLIENFLKETRNG